TISEIQEISEQFETGESDLNPSKFSTIFDRNFESRDGGLLGRLENLARINSTFDENVVETTNKNAENKTIYGFQNKTFALEFSKNVMSRNFIEQRLNKGFKVIRENSRGNPIYLNEGIEFVRNNYLLKDFVEKNGNFYTLKK